MRQLVELTLHPEEAYTPNALKRSACRKLGIGLNALTGFRILKRSLDSRQRPIRVHMRVEVVWDEPYQEKTSTGQEWRSVHTSPEVIVVGAGPAGLFASLKLLELGLKPVIVERGKPVEERKQDIALLNRNQGINPDSNYCFGEGGAGTYSDGKLYTRSTKRGDVSRILDILHFHGADPSILFENHPHIGTDRLPAIISSIRKTLTDHGATFHFNRKVSELDLSGKKIVGVQTAQGDRFQGKAVILATGHSASDIYRLLSRNQVPMEVKGFAMGVRIEHPQELIDTIQYHSPSGRGKFLPPAEYTLAKKINGRGVYSFCMCPGGNIVPSSTSSDEMVVNGMSNSRRNSPFANAGLVVEIRPEDLVPYSDHGVFAGLYYQQMVEKSAYQFGGDGFVAPGQRISDFVGGHTTTSLPDHSYHPGLVPSPMHEWLPPDISGRLQEGLITFGRRMKGFITREGIVAGVESRTSSPVRIARDSETLMNPGLSGLFPCGEGSGYSGGIVSSAIDGENVALAVSRWLAS